MNLCSFLIILGVFIFITGSWLVVQWRQRLVKKRIIYGAFMRFRFWLGGALGFANLILGLASFILAMLIR